MVNGPKDQLFKIINDFFDHVYLVTLQKSTDRHTDIKETLEGLQYEIFWGVDGGELDIQEVIDRGIYNPDMAKTKNPVKEFLVPGEIGCAMSHINIYKDMLEKGYSRSLILEDDVVVRSQNYSHLKNALSELPSNWDVFYLGCKDIRDKLTVPVSLKIRIIYPLLTLLGFKNFNAETLRHTYAESYSKHLKRAGWHFGTYAYGVTIKGAKQILAKQTPISMAADNAIGMACIENSIKAYRLRSKVFEANEQFTTTIEGRVRSKNWKYNS